MPIAPLATIDRLPLLWAAARLSPVALTVLVALAAMVGLFLLGQIPLRYNLRNLTVRWRTTLLTALAFTLVVALLVVMMAFVNGMYVLTDSSGNPENLVILSDGATDEIFSNLPASDVAELENQPGVVRQGNRPLASREAFMVVNQPIPHPPPGRPLRRFLQLRGIDDPAQTALVHRIALHTGGAWFSPAGVQPIAGKSAETAIQVVLGEGIAREMARDRWPEERARARNPDRLDVGDQFAMADRQWIVVGVMRSAGSTFDSEVWAKRSTIGPLFGKENFTSVIVRAESAAAARKLKLYFSNEYKKAAVSAQVETDYYAGLSDTNKQFSYAIGFVTVVMSIGGVFGVMNTMFAAIAQRINDIGVLRLLGFARYQVLISFLLESLAIALIGGIIGCALGSLADGLSATSIVSSGPGGGKFVVLTLTVDATILGVGLLVSLAMGAIGGLVPALSAMRLTPLEALH